MTLHDNYCAGVLKIGLTLILAMTASACSTMKREPYTRQDAASASVPGIADARVWADDTNVLPAATQRVGSRAPDDLEDIKFLALSGGGAEGAYGAGFLACWTDTGKRPEFAIVTGVSVGALLAPFAYLGPAYDPLLTQMFTSGDTKDLLQFAGLTGLFGDGLFRGEPLAKLVDTYVTPQLLPAIAIENAKGRKLLVVTTNLDTQRTAIWDMGAIAQSQAPNALALFKSVLLASASIPGIFPPKLIEVQAAGRRFQEMHTDGGVTANILVIPEAILTSQRALKAKPEIFVIVNGKLGPDFAPVDDGIVPIVQRSFETTLKSNTRNSLIASAEYARRQGWQLKVTAIPDGAQSLSPMDFDTKRMTTLYDFGCATARSDNRWTNL